MFVVSFSSSSVTKIVVSVVLVLLVTGVIIYSCFSGGAGKEAVQTNSINISSSEDILEYISTLGWEVSDEPDEIKEIIIPHQFDEVYNNYNEIQKSQGFDLTEYSGERVKLWSFTVENYPGYENKDCIKINILVYEGCVIGGDVCSVELDGFMHGLSGE